MYAILRQYPCDASERGPVGQTLADIQALHGNQPGYAGSLVIDDRQRLIAVNLWDTEHAAAAARAAIGPQVQHLLEPLMAGPSELIAAGEVLASDRKERS